MKKNLRKSINGVLKEKRCRALEELSFAHSVCVIASGE